MTFYDRANAVSERLLNHFKNAEKATHQQSAQVPDGYGGFDETWSNVADIDVTVIPMSPTDQVNNDRIENKVKAVIYAKYKDVSTFKNGDRLLFKGDAYRVHGNIDIIEAGAAVEFTCTEGEST